MVAKTAPASIVGYRSGQCRNNDYALTHTYAEMSDGNLWPMCGYGWNRSDGNRFSIFRGSIGTEGDCRLCRKRMLKGLPPVTDGWPHKTKWI